MGNLHNIFIDTFMELNSSLYLYLEGDPPSKEIIKDHLKVLELGTWYDVFTITNDFKVISTKGAIQNNGSWNYHNNYDDSENEMYVKINGNALSRRFFLKEKEARKVQEYNIQKWKVKLEAEIERVNALIKQL